MRVLIQYHKIKELEFNSIPSIQFNSNSLFDFDFDFLQNFVRGNFFYYT